MLPDIVNQLIGRFRKHHDTATSYLFPRIESMVGPVRYISRKPDKFPRDKTDFSNGAVGYGGCDLTNAYRKRVVHPGDILEVHTRRGEQRLMYRGPVDYEGGHGFFPAEPIKGMGEIVLTAMDFDHWERIDHYTPEKWRAKMVEVFGEPENF